ncbi:protein SprT [Shewanella sp. NFH-SH190041]|uniref:SprT family zinc-dependent metalloprotease n=1 Tax=Shewanella sp. NFH-SH190041 TaxID=2950245 RepID=UPI0021C2DD14|nr:SprT family zinc-dependent metalloprotease [Shewanella sp. NFH-SH190041]BDM65760.1 protein SprT [Shewanella sp. NFH-SH190041]
MGGETISSGDAKPCHDRQAQEHPCSNASQIVPDNQLQAQLLSRVEQCYNLAEHKLARAFPRPVISFKLRGKSAGTAHLQLNKLRFNPVLLRENPYAFLSDVVPHEICHLLCFQLYGHRNIKPHGPQWQALMQQIYAVTPKATHQFNTASVQGRTFPYQCGCGRVELSVRRHNKIIRQQASYHCRICHQPLKAYS